MRKRTLTNSLWIAFFMSVIVYHFIYYAQLPKLKSAGFENTSLLGYIFLFVGIFSLLLIINLDMFMLSRPKRIEVSLDTISESLRGRSEEEIAGIAKANWFINRFIICLAVAETSGILALVLGLLNGKPIVVNILFTLAYIGLIYLRIRLSASWQRMYL